MIDIAFNVLGGLAIFLLGMKNMSEGMQAVGGGRIRWLINAVTNNRLLAVGVGTLVTMMVQSSSVTTVMVVGMVNAGFMTLMQAIGVILGSNIGTTITGWIIQLKIGKYGLPILGVSAFFYLFSKNDRIRFTAMLCLGLGMIFFGLELMSNGFKPLRTMPEFQQWFSRFPADSYSGVLLCCLVGAVLTGIVQSSSATLGITMALASTGVIGFEQACALVLGENIGTTVTANLASIGGSTNAKRASLAHFFINVLGVAWITALFPFYINLIGFIFGVDPGYQTVVEGEVVFPRVMAGIALCHTGFNTVNVMLFLPLMGPLARMLEWMLPDKPHKETPHLTYLDVRMIEMPAVGLQQSKKEIEQMGKIVGTMQDHLRETLESGKPDAENERLLFYSEGTLDVIQKEIVEFLGSLVSGNLSHDDSARVRKQIRMADEYESIGDYIEKILKLLIKLRDGDLYISDEGRVELLDLHDNVRVYLAFINECVRLDNPESLREADTRSEAITHLMKSYRATHLGRVEAGTTNALNSLFYMDILNSYRRIKDHALNIAETLAGEK